MPVWKTRPVADQGSLTLESWQVVQLSDGDRHLVGYCIENREGRVSSAIRELNVRNLNAKTGTGRVYVLRGKPGASSDAQYVWSRWAAINSVTTWTDLSSIVWEEHLTAKAAQASGSES